MQIFSVRRADLKSKLTYWWCHMTSDIFAIFGYGNSFSPHRHWAIAWTNVDCTACWEQSSMKFWMIFKIYSLKKKNAFKKYGCLSNLPVNAETRMKKYSLKKNIWWQKFCFEQWAATALTHWGRDKMVAFSQMTLENPFSWMKMFEFRLNFHWSWFLRVQLTIFQQWFRLWLGADKVTSHYLNQWWLDCWCICASIGLNELTGHVHSFNDWFSCIFHYELYPRHTGD